MITLWRRGQPAGGRWRSALQGMCEKVTGSTGDQLESHWQGCVSSATDDLVQELGSTNGLPKRSLRFLRAGDAIDATPTALPPHTMRCRE